MNDEAREWGEQFEAMGRTEFDRQLLEPGCITRIEYGVAMEDHQAFQRLVTSYQHANPDKLMTNTTVMELAIWSGDRLRKLITLPPLPAVCSHCGKPYGPDTHVCEGGADADPS